MEFVRSTIVRVNRLAREDLSDSMRESVPEGQTLYRIAVSRTDQPEFVQLVPVSDRFVRDVGEQTAFGVLENRTVRLAEKTWHEHGDDAG